MASTSPLSADALDLPSICAVAAALHPRWSSDGVPASALCASRISGGITNAVFRVAHALRGESALVRVYGAGSERFIERAADTALVVALAGIAQGPALWGTFANGRVEEFFEGFLPLAPADMAMPRDGARIARATAALHGATRQWATPACTPALWERVHGWLRMAGDLRARRGGAVDDVARAARCAEWAERVLPSAKNGHGRDLVDARRAELRAEGLPPALVDARVRGAQAAMAVVFCHNDLLAGNCLARAGSDRLRLIDFEYAAPNYRAYEAANHWVEVSGFELDAARFPTGAQRRAWVDAYLAAAGGDACGAPADADAAELDAFAAEFTRVAERFTVASHLWWGTWSLVQACVSEIDDFDFAEYAMLRLGAHGFDAHAREFFGDAAPSTGAREPLPLIASAAVALPCPRATFDETLAFFVDTLGFRVGSIAPADAPEHATISAYGLVLRLERGERSADGIEIRLATKGDRAFGGARELVAPNGARIVLEPPLARAAPAALPPAPAPSLILSPTLVDGGWAAGRAGLLYRDLLPGRLNGRVIASHIRIENEGPVPDYVHFHEVAFQLIFVNRGWVRVVYEDAGAPFTMRAGDCVLQPPRIRHRVLAASAGLEVVEVAAPASHATFADADLPLPNGESPVANRDFSGQRFVFHSAEGAAWREDARRHADCDFGIARATGGLVRARAIRSAGKAGGGSLSGTAASGLQFFFVSRGSATLTTLGVDSTLAEGAAAAVPPEAEYELKWERGDVLVFEVASSGGEVFG
jgi:thiamine kinase-like enzyme/quercetin dioxygenase-like cupin family protein